MILINSDGSMTKEIRMLTEEEHDLVVSTFEAYDKTRAGWKKAFKQFTKAFANLYKK
jgi:hypothetical protein